MTTFLTIIDLLQDPEKGFVVKAGSLGFSVIIYTIFAIVALCLIIARRYLSIFGKGELGGNNGKGVKNTAN